MSSNYFTIDLSFYLTLHCYGKMKRDVAVDEFRKRVVEEKLLNKIVEDMLWLMEG